MSTAWTGQGPQFASWNNGPHMGLKQTHVCAVYQWFSSFSTLRFKLNESEMNFVYHHWEVVVRGPLLLLVEGVYQRGGSRDKTMLQKELGYLLKLPHLHLGIYCSTKVQKRTEKHKLLHWSSHSSAKWHITLYKLLFTNTS